MSQSVSRLVFATVAAAVVAIAAAYFLSPVRSDISPPLGLLFWIGATFLASALPVRLPRGTVVSVGAAPMIASMALGGPLAAAVVAGLGTVDSREIRGQVPWYGTLFNHSAAVISIVLGGFVFELVLAAGGGLAAPTAAVLWFVAVAVGSSIFYLANWTLAVAAVSVRTGVPIRTVWAQDVAGIATSYLGLVPLGWLMAQVFLLPNGVGWWATALFIVPLLTTRMAYHRYVETRELFEQTITALAHAVDARDWYTRYHSQRVSSIAEAMSRAMRLPESIIESIRWAGLLHDVGKIGIRDNILLKEGPLDKEERYLMNQHPRIGADIVAPATQLAREAPLILAHHEWFNGSGYPNGTEALDIPMGARILSVADAYEAMTSSRPYRKTPLTHEQAVGELEKYAGIQFDPEIVPVLVGLDREILDAVPPSRADEPTSLNIDPRAAQGTAAASTTEEVPGRSRPALASDDVS